MSILEVNHIKKVYKTRMGGDEVMRFFILDFCCDTEL